MGNNRSRRTLRERDRQDIFPPSFTENRSSHSRGGVCTAIVGSMTQAMRARDALGEAAIRATVVKVSSSATHNGCAYGVEFPCVQQANVRDVLRSASITVRGIQ